MNYSEKLKDPRWQKKRLEILNRDKWCCRACGDKESTLHVHHKYYITDREPWEYPDICLVSLCENCHQLQTSQNIAKENLSNYIIDELSNSEAQIANWIFQSGIRGLEDIFNRTEILEMIYLMLSNVDEIKKLRKLYIGERNK